MLEAARFQICTKKERLTHTAKERRKERQMHTKREGKQRRSTNGFFMMSSKK